MIRLPKDHYALLLAYTARLRSEDPYLRVGSVALSADNRVIGTGYNGLCPGKEVDETFWDDRDGRLPYLIHSEVNVCSLVRRGEAHTVAVTTLPCRSCAAVLVAHGVKRVVYCEPYHRDDMAIKVFKFAGVELIHLEQGDLRRAITAAGILTLDDLLK